jgi:hypothetical protein
MSQQIDPSNGPPSGSEGLSINDSLVNRQQGLQNPQIENDQAISRPTIEDEVAERVLAKLAAMANEPQSLPPPERVLVLNTTQHPAALTLAAPPPPQGAVLQPPDSAEQRKRSWFLLQLLSEIHLTLRMYFDPRYRISRTTQFALPSIALAMILNYFFFSFWFSILFLSPIAERILIVVLGIVGYKLLTRELARYREVLDYLNKYAPR